MGALAAQPYDSNAHVFFPKTSTLHFVASGLPESCHFERSTAGTLRGLPEGREGEEGAPEARAELPHEMAVRWCEERKDRVPFDH
jgi:hypothetical protein